MNQAALKTTMAALLLVPMLALAQGSDAASRIKKKSPPAAAAAVEEPEVSFTPHVPLTLEAAPAPAACVQPPLIKAFSSQARADKFNAALGDYQACIRNYAEINTQAANQHTEAANRTIREANEYFTALSSKGDKPAAE